VNLECDVEFWLEGAQFLENWKQEIDCLHTVPHRGPMNELANHLNTAAALSHQLMHE